MKEKPVKIKERGSKCDAAPLTCWGTVAGELLLRPRPVSLTNLDVVGAVAAALLLALRRPGVPGPLSRPATGERERDPSPERPAFPSAVRLLALFSRSRGTGVRGLRTRALRRRGVLVFLRRSRPVSRPGSLQTLHLLGAFLRLLEYFPKEDGHDRDGEVKGGNGGAEGDDGLGQELDVALVGLDRPLANDILPEQDGRRPENDGYGPG